MARLLVERWGADIRARANSGDCPLAAAAFVGSPALLKLLLHAASEGLQPVRDLKAFVDDQNSSGYSALMWAADRGHVKALNLLLDRGASLSLANAEGDTALHVAANGIPPSPQACELLVLRGASVDATNKAGDTPLHGAAMGQAKAHPRVAAVLLKLGAGAEVPNASGQTPEGLAKMWRTDDVDVAFVFQRHKRRRKARAAAATAGGAPRGSTVVAAMATATSRPAGATTMVSTASVPVIPSPNTRAPSEEPEKRAGRRRYQRGIWR